MRILLPALTALMLAGLAACGPEAPPGSGRTTQSEAAVAAVAPGSGPGPAGLCRGAPIYEAPPLNPCAGPARLSLAFAGDVLLHDQLQAYGYQVGFHSIWSQAQPYLRSADIAVANLEGPVAPGLARGGARRPDPGPVMGEVYTGYPAFNYHPVVLRDLAAAGVDLVTTANNHALDRGPRGVDLTLAEAARAGLGTVGSIAAGAPRGFVTRRATPAGTLAFVACSFGTNGIADPGRQVLLCYRDRAELLALVRREAADPGVAGVVVLPHWGSEYRSAPEAAQSALARELVAAGATAVVGTHPHAVQPFAALAGPRGAAPVVYSTGNFVATQDFMPSKVGALALLELCPGPGGKLVAARAGWIATQMTFTSRGYWLDIAPRGAAGYAGQPEAWLRRVAPGFAAQPAPCR